MDDKSEDTFELVGTPEADVGANKISLISPIGKAIMSHTVGDVVSIDAPNGAYQVKILKVNL